LSQRKRRKRQSDRQPKHLKRLPMRSALRITQKTGRRRGRRGGRKRRGKAARKRRRRRHWKRGNARLRRSWASI